MWHAIFHRAVTQSTANGLSAKKLPSRSGALEILHGNLRDVAHALADLFGRADDGVVVGRHHDRAGFAVDDTDVVGDAAGIAGLVAERNAEIEPQRARDRRA